MVCASRMFSGGSDRSVRAFWPATLNQLDGKFPAHARLRREDPPAMCPSSMASSSCREAATRLVTEHGDFLDSGDARSGPRRSNASRRTGWTYKVAPVHFNHGVRYALTRWLWQASNRQARCPPDYILHKTWLRGKSWRTARLLDGYAVQRRHRALWPGDGRQGMTGCSA